MAKRLPRLRVGQRFGRLRVAIPVGWRKGKRAVLCVCDCGNINAPIPSHLFSGRSQSCGCLSREKLLGSQTTHGRSKTHIYAVYIGMKNRCSNVNHKDYRHYGARGIKVCDRWQVFENFLADMGERPSGMTLERRDNNLGYCPENCSWQSRKVQSNNTRNNRLITFKGKTQNLASWSEELGIKSDTIRQRIDVYGWSIEDALSTPVWKRRRSQTR